ncbi:serine hydrolase domain-containing protein [Microbacterium paraoxydans]|uniref:serine hydrolase domain-containing protein n=1 Tax=Microbacterium paraoxydans TaxID=199592 RepID=UPI001CFA42FA|nr:serine hydrolase domain-containing protein [Microbacterium paraoxydans]
MMRRRRLPLTSARTRARHPRAHARGARARVATGLAAVGIFAVLLSGCSGTPTPTPSTGSDSEKNSSALRPAAPEGELPADLQTELQRIVEQAMVEYAVPGAAVGVWIPGEGSWISASGLADIEGDVPVSLDMTWPLRSVTKSYTVTLILQLVDAGEVSLDDTIDRYVDGITNGDRITLRQLADMSSGNADYTSTEGFGAAYSADESTLFTLDQLNGFVVDQPPRFAPGTQRIYTNANTNLLGAIVEQVTGQSFGEALDERILQPLGQSGTHYILDAANWTEHPLGYAMLEGEQVVQNDNLSIYGPAGSMVSTLDDALVWAQALGSGLLVEPSTQAERQDGAPLDEGPPYDRYAVGVGETNGWWGHNGEGLGFTAAVFHDPETSASIAVFMNESNVIPKAHPADQTFRRIADLLAGRSTE